MELAPIKRRQRIYEEIVDRMYDMLSKGEYPVGTKLPSEGVLAERFNVSKTVVREAMSVLKTNGIIESRPGSGNYVCKIEGGTFVTSVRTSLLNKQSIIEILELRRALEVEAASLAAERATQQDISKLKQINSELENARTFEDAVELDFNFHQCICHATHNSAFITVFNSITPLLKDVIKQSKLLSSRIPGRHEEGVNEHQQIIAAIDARNIVEARKSMRAHLENNELKSLNITIGKKD